mgnify:FL=1
MASDKNLILGAAMAAPKFNTGFVDIVDKEVKEFTDRVEKEARDRRAEADAISMDTANFIASLPANPNLDFLDKSMKTTVEAFLAKTRMDLAGLYRTRRGDRVTYAPGTEAYEQITRQIEAGGRKIDNLLGQLQSFQADKADYRNEQNSISRYWKEQNLDMFADMKSIYLDEKYTGTVDENGNVIINGKYKLKDWESGDDIKLLDWGVTDSGYVNTYAAVMEAASKYNVQLLTTDNPTTNIYKNQIRNYFSSQSDGGIEAVTSIIMDNPELLGFNILQADDNLEKLKQLVKDGKYYEAIDEVVNTSMRRIIGEQNLVYNKTNASVDNNNDFTQALAQKINLAAETVNEAYAFATSNFGADQSVAALSKLNLGQGDKFMSRDEFFKVWSSAQSDINTKTVNLTTKQFSKLSDEEKRKLFDEAYGEGDIFYDQKAYDFANQEERFKLYLNQAGIDTEVINYYIRQIRKNDGFTSVAGNISSPSGTKTPPVFNTKTGKFEGDVVMDELLSNLEPVNITQNIIDGLKDIEGNN